MTPDQPEAIWNAELRRLAAGLADDDALAAALARHDRRRQGFRLDEPTALALYQRNPGRFGDFVRAHVRRQPGSAHPGGAQPYGRLRAAARACRDEDLYWYLFRELATEREWRHAIEALLRTNPPPDRLDAELRRRHPHELCPPSPGALVALLERYGPAALDYIEDHLGWATRREPAQILAAIARAGDEARYWRAFFRVAGPRQWNAVLRALLARPLTLYALHAEIAQRTPPRDGWSGWSLDPDVALALYRRDPDGFRPFLARFVLQPEPALFSAAAAARDDDLLDHLSYRALRRSAWLAALAAPAAAPAPSPRPHPDPRAREELAALGALLVARFERLYAESPDLYVRHAARILSHYQAHDVWSLGAELAHSPAWTYLTTRHPEAWCRARFALRDLLTSPNAQVQRLALDLLLAGAARPDSAEIAARRVLENLPLLRALLRGPARRATKKQVRACLEHAARHGGAFAALVLPVLAEAAALPGS